MAFDYSSGTPVWIPGSGGDLQGAAKNAMKYISDSAAAVRSQDPLYYGDDAYNNSTEFKYDPSGNWIDTNGSSADAERDSLQEFADGLADLFDPNSDRPTGSGRSSSRNIGPALDYYQAALAQHYGMNRATAYQEALANTAHQREVADLKAAGLNPVLGFSGSGASTFAANMDSGSSSGSGHGGHSSSAKDLGLDLHDVTDLAGTVMMFIPGARKFAYPVKAAGRVLDNVIDKFSK